MPHQRLTVLFLPLLLLLAACSGNDDTADPTATPSPTEAAPPAASVLEIDGTDGVTVTLTEAPERIVSLAPHATEVICVIGAGDRLVAVDSFENCPAGSSDKPALDSFTPSVEAIAGYEPDLVYMFYDPGDIAASLRDLGITALVLDVPEDLEGVYANIQLIGDITEQRDAADALVQAMQDDFDAIVARTEAAEGDAPTYYHELDNTFFTLRSDTFIGSLYTVLGAENIADDAESRYPQLSAEAIVESDPDVIVLVHTETPADVAARPGWSGIAAVQNERICQLDGDLLSRPGPRIMEGLESLAACLYPED